MITFTGIGRYIVELSTELQKIPEIQLEGACKLSRWKKRNKIKKYLPDIKLNVFPSLYKRPMLFHGADFVMSYHGNAKKVITIHDLAVFYPHLVDNKRIETPENGRIQKLLKSNKVDAVITVSEFTKNEILNFFLQLDKPVFVTPLAADHRNFVYERKNPEPYLLYVGPLDKRKNALGLCKAFEQIADQYPDFRLIMVGGQNGFQAEKVLHCIAQSPFKYRFVCLPLVSEQTLQDLYAKAFAFVFPSFYEGFGIPVLEALHYGLPVLTSQQSVMEEVAGEAVLYVNPYQITSIAEGLEKIITDDTLRKSLVSKSNTRVSAFSWKNTVKKTFDAYANLLSG